MRMSIPLFSPRSRQTPGPTATRSVEEVRIEVSQQLSLHPEGIPIEPVSYVDWFDPTDGLHFYRPEGGDGPRAPSEVSPLCHSFLSV